MREFSHETPPPVAGRGSRGAAGDGGALGANSGPAEGQRRAARVDDAPTLNAVAILSASDGWAVGGKYPQGGALIQHWDGSGWSPVALPHAAQPSSLYDVDALASDDVWAVGDYVRNGSDTSPILHWDGTRWRFVTTPPATGYSALRDISASSPSDARAVGQTFDELGDPMGVLIWHWDGSAWTDWA